MEEKLKIIIERWFKCEITGDEAMSQIAKIYEDRVNENKVIE